MGETDARPDIRNFTLGQLDEVFRALGQPAFRVGQVLKWLYQKRVDSFDQMTNMSKGLRDALGERFALSRLRQEYRLESRDCDAVKFGFLAGSGGETVESVVLIDGKRRTACLSSQLGCALNCAFCETGRMGLVRNLTLFEIVGQLVAINDFLASRDDKDVTNIVFMGMGEAFANMGTFIHALEIIISDNAFGVGRRRITVSTAGLVPAIREFMRRGPRIGLAISLNTYSNEKRDRLVPINRKYPIEELVRAAREYAHWYGQWITFEYVVIDGENNTPEAAVALSRYLKGIACKVNLIGVNPSTGIDFASPSPEVVNDFAGELMKHGLSVTVRKSRGRDILGACGQLASRSVANSVRTEVAS